MSPTTSPGVTGRHGSPDPRHSRTGLILHRHSPGTPPCCPSTAASTGSWFTRTPSIDDVAPIAGILYEVYLDGEYHSTVSAYIRPDFPAPRGRSPTWTNRERPSRRAAIDTAGNRSRPNNGITVNALAERRSTRVAGRGFPVVQLRHVSLGAMFHGAESGGACDARVDGKGGQVNDEVLPPAPPVARDLFPGEAWGRAEAYAALLAGPGVVRGLLGPREVPRIWDRHLLNCAVVAEEIPPTVTLVDIGSGAGLPGIVLAIVRPDITVTLLEPLLRRVTFLQECVAELKLDNVEVLRGRAEEIAGKRVFDVAVARAVAPLDRLLAWSMPLLRENGVLLAMKGERAAEELEAAESQLRACGAVRAELVSVGRGKVEPPATLVRVVAGRPPRQARQASRRRRKR